MRKLLTFAITSFEAISFLNWNFSILHYIENRGERQWIWFPLRYFFCGMLSRKRRTQAGNGTEDLLLERGGAVDENDTCRLARIDRFGGVFRR